MLVVLVVLAVMSGVLEGLEIESDRRAALLCCLEKLFWSFLRRLGALVSGLAGRPCFFCSIVAIVAIVA